MRLLFNEIKKLADARLHIVIPAILLIACAAVCFLTVPGSGGYSGAAADRAAEELYAAFSHDPEGLEAFKERYHEAVKAKTGELLQKYGDALPDLHKHPELLYTFVFSPDMPDSLLLRGFEETEARTNEYNTGVNTVIAQAVTNMERLKQDAGAGLSDPLYQYQAYAYLKYVNVRDNAAVGTAPVRGWDTLFSWNYGGIFLFASLIIFANAVFIPEKRRGMLPVLRTAKRGRLATAAAKTALLILGSAILSLLFALVPFAVILIKQGCSDPSATVQNIRALALFPEVWSIKRFFLYDLGMKLLAGTAFGALCGAVSLLTYELVSSLAIGSLLFGVSFACANVSAAGFPLVHALNAYSAYDIAAVSDRLHIIQPGLKCISLNAAAPAACAVWLALGACTCVLLFAFKRGRAGSAGGKLKAIVAASIAAVKTKTHRKGRPSKTRKHGGSLIGWELRKLFFANTPVLLAVIVLFAAWLGFLAFRRVQTEPTREYRIWKTFLLTETEGDFPEKREQYLLLLSAYSSPNTGKELLDEALDQGRITPEQHSRYSEALNKIREGELADDLGYASELYFEYTQLADEGMEPHFTDTAGAEPIITGGASYPLYAALLLILLGAYLKERGGKDANEHFERILRSTKNGRMATFRAKLAAGLLIALALFLLFNAAEFAVLTAGRSLRALSAPLCSFPGLAAVSKSMTAGGYMALMYAVRLIAALLITLFAFAVSALSRSFVSAFGAALGITLLPTLVFKAGLTTAGCASFMSFFGANEMLLFSAEKQLLRSSFGVLALFTAAFAAITLLLLFKAYRKTVK